MAGAGYKLFATGDVLTAAQVNTYLMQQTVMVFASSAARTTALSGVLAEGMVSYLQDTNTLEVYDGAAWVGATGDITGLTAGTGISISSATGPVPTVTNSMATEIAAKGDLIAGTGSATFDNLTVGANNLVLTADSSTTTGLKWAAPDPLTTKGDLFTYSTTEARLAVGNDGETLVADSSTATGLKWAAPSSGSSYVAGKNGAINGGFDIWQRGTSFTASTAEYTADRWQKWVGSANFTVTRQASGLTGILYCSRFQRNSGATTTGTIDYWSSFESQDSYRFAGQTVTFSFYARAGANYSPTSNALQARLFSGTGTDQNLQVGGFTGVNTVINQTATLTTSWQRFSYTGSVASSATQVGLQFSYAPTGTAGANDYYEVTGVQLEIASTASAFSRNAGTIQGELSACMRYYVASPTAIIYIPNNFSTGYRYAVQYPVPMRGTPTVTATGYSGGGTQVVSEFISSSGFQTGANGPTSGPYFTQYTASAEL
jgi:hypothetical protein